MGIRSRIFFIVFVLLSISIAVTYVVAERDLNNTFKQETLNELENLFLILPVYRFIEVDHQQSILQSHFNF